MKLSEIIKKGVVKFDTAESLKGRMFIKGKPTTCMQVRVMLPEDRQGCGSANTLFPVWDGYIPRTQTGAYNLWKYMALYRFALVGRNGKSWQT